VLLLAAVGLATACILPACSSDDDALTPGGQSSDDGPILITIEVPPEIEAFVLDLAAELSEHLCRRARTCCPRFGLPPRTDCMQMAGEAITFGLVSQTLFESEAFQYATDPVYAERCIEAAREVADDCVFDTEPVSFAWALPCSLSVRALRQGQELAECATDGHCEARLGSGYACWESNCRPIVEVPVGASCRRASSPDSVPECQADAYCDFDTCEPRASLGEACRQGDACVLGAFCNDDGICQPRRPEGEDCRSGECLEELTCGCILCTEAVCTEVIPVGGACQPGDACNVSECRDGICTPQVMGICQEP
jgi:hypothetical protein